jgi:ADP-ribose diphosphatase
MKRLSSKTVYEGRVAKVRLEEFRYDDGGTEEREVVGHPGAVAVIARDDDAFFMVRQPREPVDEPALLELPAGRLDVDGESRLECAQRELGEEIGRRAARWRELVRFYPSPGLLEEEVTVFLAEELSEVEAESDDDERLEVVRIPLADLDETIDDCRDGKSLIGLMLLREELRAGA